MANSLRAAAGSSNPIFSDVELKIISRHGPTGWDGIVVLSPAVPAGKPALLRVPHPVELEEDMAVRVLDAAVATDSEQDYQPAIITLGMFSEMFAIPLQV